MHLRRLFGCRQATRNSAAYLPQASDACYPKVTGNPGLNCGATLGRFKEVVGCQCILPAVVVMTVAN